MNNNQVDLSFLDGPLQPFPVTNDQQIEAQQLFFQQQQNNFAFFQQPQINLQQQQQQISADYLNAILNEIADLAHKAIAIDLVQQLQNKTITKEFFMMQVKPLMATKPTKKTTKRTRISDDLKMGKKAKLDKFDFDLDGPGASGSSSGGGLMIQQQQNSNQQYTDFNSNQTMIPNRDYSNTNNAEESKLELNQLKDPSLYFDMRKEEENLRTFDIHDSEDAEPNGYDPNVDRIKHQDFINLANMKTIVDQVAEKNLLSTVSNDAYVYIALAAQDRLRALVEKMCRASKHRTGQLANKFIKTQASSSSLSNLRRRKTKRKTKRKKLSSMMVKSVGDLSDFNDSYSEDSNDSNEDSNDDEDDSDEEDEDAMEECNEKTPPPPPFDVNLINEPKNQLSDIEKREREEEKKLRGIHGYDTSSNTGGENPTNSNDNEFDEDGNMISLTKKGKKKKKAGEIPEAMKQQATNLTALQKSGANVYSWMNPGAAFDPTAIKPVGAQSKKSKKKSLLAGEIAGASGSWGGEFGGVAGTFGGGFGMQQQQQQQQQQMKKKKVELVTVLTSTNGEPITRPMHERELQRVSLADALYCLEKDEPLRNSNLHYRWSMSLK